MAKPSASQAPQPDPLSDEQARALLAFTGVIRDPLHGDIQITSLERAIIDTDILQRLKRIRQLAMVDLVYPGATHNRFLHSLGVLHVCNEMLMACNQTARNVQPLSRKTEPVPLRITPYGRLLSRLVALLHDAAHISFGHVLEREARVIPLGKDEWQDDWRQNKVFGETSEVRQVVTRCLERFQAESRTAGTLFSNFVPQVATTALLRDVRDVLCAEKDKVRDLRYPFVYDLVSNTLCADLVDYLKRDMFFCGLPGDIGTRCLQYLGVVAVHKAAKDPGGSEGTVIATDATDAFPRREIGGAAEYCRVALLPYRYNNRGGATTKPYILAEAVDLVRRRKMLAEAAYFHKTKLCATAMLGAAAYGAGIASGEDIWDQSDDDVLKLISTATRPSDTDLNDPTVRSKIRTATLGNKLRTRHLFKPIYRIAYLARGSEVGRILWDEVYPLFSVAKNRDEMLDLLERIIQAAHHSDPTFDPRRAFGAIAISCPEAKMQVKGLGMLVLQDPAVTKLLTLEDAATHRNDEWLLKEIDAIKTAHRHMWCLEVCVDPDVVPPTESLAKDLVGIVRAQAKGLPNSVDMLKQVQPVDPAVVLAKYKDEYVTNRNAREKRRMDSVEFKQLVQVGETRSWTGTDLFITTWQREYDEHVANTTAPDA